MRPTIDKTKRIHASMVAAQVRRYKAKGGTITVVPPVPVPPRAEVNVKSGLLLRVQEND